MTELCLTYYHLSAISAILYFLELDYSFCCTLLSQVTSNVTEHVMKVSVLSLRYSFNISLQWISVTIKELVSLEASSKEFTHRLAAGITLTFGVKY